MIKYTYGGEYMNTKQKDFLSIDNLIKNIKNKGLLIKDENKLKEVFKHNNYYFITGYKEPFKDSKNIYKKNVYFEDILELYHFDKKLKLIFAEILFEIEQNVKTTFLNNFCARYGYKDIDLIDPNNYDVTNHYLTDVIKKLNDQIHWYGKTNQAVSYYKKQYGSVPIWVLVKVLSFGMIRDLIMNQKSNDKDHICKSLVSDKTLKVTEIQNLLELLITYRNICCHDDKLFGFIHSKVNIKTTSYHSHFNLLKNSNTYIQGKKDLFAALIAIKYFVNKEVYNDFIDNISNLVEEYSKKINSLSKQEILKYMFLPENFIDLKDM